MRQGHGRIVSGVVVHLVPPRHRHDLRAVAQDEAVQVCQFPAAEGEVDGVGKLAEREGPPGHEDPSRSWPVELAPSGAQLDLDGQPRPRHVVAPPVAPSR